jgi:anti-sigma regulatory factor (Ser/Thr protein kinase)/O-antigen/teichoic acid export membrane protein
VFNSFLIGQALGVFPLFVGNQLAAFLSLENKAFRTTLASIVYIIANLILNYIFVQVMHLEALGLALAASLGMWIFMLVQAQYFFSSKASIKLKFKGLRWDDIKEIITTGIPGAIGNGYQTIRGFIVNGLLISYVGSAGISAFTASNAILAFFWAIPAGMLNVSRMLMSVSVGEEDRTTLTNVMRTALFRVVPLQCAVSAFIILMAKPFTMMFYQDVTDPVFGMTLMGYRILPICMPLAVVLMHFSCYALTSGRKYMVHIYGLLDGWVWVSLFTWLMIPRIGMNAVYYANVLNGIMGLVAILIFAIISKKGVPKNMDELMVVPADFGVDDDHRIEFKVRSIEDVTGTSESVQTYCKGMGIDRKRAYYVSLSLEEMAGNVVNHGFTMDSKPHNLTARAIVKDDDIILCIKDDCQPFDPIQRQRIADPEDKTSNIGLRMVYRIAKDFTYQNVLGLNVLTIKI